MADPGRAAVRAGATTSDRTIADLLVERLRAWRVPRVFGQPGEGVALIVEALRRAGGDPAFVPSRQPEGAGFMAAGHAKYTGGVGICLATQGPGALHLLGGLYDAKLDGKPMVALVGQQTYSALGSAYQEIELPRLFSDVCAQFLRTAAVPEQVPYLLDQAIRTAVSTRSPTCLVVPHDLLNQVVPDGMPHPDGGGVLASAPGLPPARVMPHETDLNAAAQLLAAGQRVAILVGQGGYGAADEIMELADRLDAGVATSLLGKPVLDERLPYHTGVLGQVGTAASAQLMAGCDTLLMVGTNDPWTGYYPVPGQATAVQIDIDGSRLASRYPIDVPLVGDARETLRALLSRVPQRRNRDWRDMIEGAVDRARTECDARAEERTDRLNPRLVLRELSPRLPADASVAVDVGSVTYWYARHLQLPPGTRAHLCGTLASVGSAVPYAIAAKFARPDRPVFVLLGDGAMQSGGLAELITVAQHWPEWPDPRLVVLVLNNSDQAGRGGEPERGPDTAPVTAPGAELDRPAAPGMPPPDAVRGGNIPYAGWARLLGLHGIGVDRPEQIGPAWEEAMAAERPTLIEAVVDPSIPLDAPEQPFADLRGLTAGGLDEAAGTAVQGRARALRNRATNGADLV
ncbi:thiamine pyrophosphate-binding protein [Plantactinospora endophytica]|uniref:Thiamine pyrophosphate-requiring protein n=1 Tax=Plantactinospora endophytica TaxID=673535 RepID=A0ABQ4DZA4_9ACTN|nr:thiamine pyrophosphate-binding protein [Plantactinospora endophytica]GIG87391.1 thiamine pyrophosphate-requiring protein [Plantactinospora endophytica]